MCDQKGVPALTALLLALVVSLVPVRAAEQFADPAFRALWERTDGPVAALAVQRTFLWGPTPISGAVQEKYAQSPGGMRLVQYFDKSRMEITQPGSAQTSAFYVTNGLLVIELMTGYLFRVEGTHFGRMRRAVYCLGQYYVCTTTAGHTGGRL